MIYEKTLLNTDLKYDTETEKLYRFHKIFKRWTLVDPKIIYYKKKNEILYNKIRIGTKNLSIYRLIYYVCHNDFDIFNSSITIDHINVDNLDNRLGNLRIATHSQQQKNKLNYSGELIKGFTICNDGRKKKFRGYYYKDGKQITKCFLTEQEAVAFHNDNRERF